MAKPPKINPPVFGRSTKSRTVHRKTPKGPSLGAELKASASNLGNKIGSGLATAGKTAATALRGRQLIKDTLSSRKTNTEITNFTNATKVTIGNIPKGSMEDGTPVPKSWKRPPAVMAVAGKWKSSDTPAPTPRFKGKPDTPAPAPRFKGSPDTPAPEPKFKKGTKVKSGPTGPGFEGKATHAGAKFGRQVASMPSPEVSGQMGGKNSTNMEPPAKAGGFFSKVKAALTKKPTNQPTTEYAQIMADIQPKKKK